MKKIGFVILILLCFTISSKAQQEKYLKVKIDLSVKTIGQLMQFGIAQEGDYKKGSYYICELPASDVEKLRNNGFLVDVLVNDMAKFYQNRNLNSKSPEKGVSICGSSIPNYTMPSRFRHGTMGGYLNYEELLSELDSMHKYYPSLISTKAAIDTFHTLEGRPITFVKISDNVNVDENEPEILYLSLTHAREPMGMQQLVWFMWYLLENYSTNSEIAYLVNNSELYFIPVVNPDGYVYNHTTNPTGGGMWRKNRRSNGGGAMGVDLNRNYGYEWGFDDVGSSIDPTAETYRGTAGFSESENKTIKWFCEHRQFKLLIDYHTYSNILLYPWGYANMTTPDQPIFLEYAKLLTSDNHFAYGTPGEILYTTNGGSFDWFYGEQTTKGKIISFSPEAGSPDDGFWPAENRIDILCNTFATMNLMMARLTNKYATLENLSPNIINESTSKVKFSLKILGLDTTGTFTVSLIDPNGVCSSIGAPKNFSNLHLLQQFSDSISFVLNSSLSQGSAIKLLLNVANGSFSRTDTLNFVYGSAVTLINDSCNNLYGWTSEGGSWITTPSTYVSAPNSITDGLGNYADNTIKSITTTQNVDLTQSVYAELSFMTKWAIEKGYDYVQIKVSDDNGISWTPLCGKYTVEGSINQAFGEPLYDGIQNNWVNEHINLNDYIGKLVKFRFTLTSDAGANANGFYFDDFKVLKINQTPIQINNIQDGDIAVSVLPNPSSGFVFIKFNSKQTRSINVVDLMGSVVYKTQNENTQTVELNLSHLQKGVYFARISSSNNTSECVKLILY
jgi:hypothetical protein